MEDIIKRNREFVVLDLETTGFSPLKGGRIIEIAAVKIIDGKIVDKRSQLINPEIKIPKKITELTGIDDEMVKGKPTYREVLPNFYKFVENAVIVAHNARFDWDTFLLHYLDKVGISPNNYVVDTLSLSKKYLKNTDNKYKLGYLCEKVNIPLKDAHRALDDAYATAELFLHLANNHIIRDGNSVGQLTLDIPEPTTPKNQSVRSISYWEKEIKGFGLKQRLYVTLDRSIVFYDIKSGAWEVKKSNEPISFESIENEIFKKTQLDDMNKVVKKYERRAG